MTMSVSSCKKPMPGSRTDNVNRLELAFRMFITCEQMSISLQGTRDALPRGRTPHALTLTYKLNLQEGGKIIPRLPMMNGCASSKSRCGQMAVYWRTANSMQCGIWGSPTHGMATADSYDESQQQCCFGRVRRSDAAHLPVCKSTAGTCGIELLSRCRYVYDGVLEAQFIMVHDANKQLLGVADIYPGAIQAQQSDMSGCLLLTFLVSHRKPAHTYCLPCINKLPRLPCA